MINGSEEIHKDIIKNYTMIFFLFFRISFSPYLKAPVIKLCSGKQYNIMDAEYESCCQLVSIHIHPSIIHTRM